MTTPTPIVSVILPFHREKFFLAESIDSILQQSLTKLEIILIASDADAATFSIAEQHAKKDDRIRLLIAPAPGLSNALNYGLQHATAPFIARMDADDIAAPERLEKQIRFLQNNPTIGVVSCQTSGTPSSQQSTGIDNYIQWQNSLITPETHYTNRFIESPIAHPTVVFRKSIYEQHGGYSTEGIPEDYDRWLHWMAMGIRFQKIPEVLLYWRDHPDRLTRTSADYALHQFTKVKAGYFKQWLAKKGIQKRVIVCGAGPEARKKAAIFETAGIDIAGFSDLVKREIPDKIFLPETEIQAGSQWYFLSLLAGRGKAAEMDAFLRNRGLRPGKDYTIAA
ncbi:MAG: glycosyltransferase [Bacteroidia bacterium]|nr:glycosyltransferase [Bacteroidia bacterium]